MGIAVTSNAILHSSLISLQVERALQEVYEGEGAVDRCEGRPASDASNGMQYGSADEERREEPREHPSYKRTMSKVTTEATVAKGMLCYRLTVMKEVLLMTMAALGIHQSSLQTGRFPQATVGGWREAYKGSRAEYFALFRDLCDLSAPDFEISGRRKLDTIARIRCSYSALSNQRFSA